MEISRWIAHWAEWAPSKAAIRFEGAWVTYRELEDRIAALAGFLRQSGTTPSSPRRLSDHGSPSGFRWPPGSRRSACSSRMRLNLKAKRPHCARKRGSCPPAADATE
jgi:hypothetical protein